MKNIFIKIKNVLYYPVAKIKPFFSNKDTIVRNSIITATIIAAFGAGIYLAIYDLQMLKFLFNINSMLFSIPEAIKNQIAIAILPILSFTGFGAKAANSYVKAKRLTNRNKLSKNYKEQLIKSFKKNSQLNINPQEFQENIDQQIQPEEQTANLETDPTTEEAPQEEQIATEELVFEPNHDIDGVGANEINNLIENHGAELALFANQQEALQEQHQNLLKQENISSYRLVKFSSTLSQTLVLEKKDGNEQEPPVVIHNAATISTVVNSAEHNSNKIYEKILRSLHIKRGASNNPIENQSLSSKSPTIKQILP